MIEKMTKYHSSSLPGKSSHQSVTIAKNKFREETSREQVYFVARTKQDVIYVRTNQE